MSLPTDHAPYVLALIICDAVHVDPGTGKRTLLGTFSAFGAQHFPATLRQICVYAALTDGRGETPIRITITDCNEDRKPVFDQTVLVDMSDPRLVGELTCPIRNVVFELPGEYRVQLFGCGELLMERRLMVLKPPEETQ